MFIADCIVITAAQKAFSPAYKIENVQVSRVKLFMNLYGSWTRVRCEPIDMCWWNNMAHQLHSTQMYGSTWSIFVWL